MKERLPTMPRDLARCLPFHGAALAAAAGLKLFHRRAGADDLDWILAPTAWTAEILSGMRFEREAGSGWISHSHRLILGPACAGVSFMTIAFLALSLPLLHRFKSAASRSAWLATGFALAFLLAVGTNSVRIVAAARLYGMDLYGGWVTPGMVHRLAGIVLYAVSLLLAYLAVDRLVPPASPWQERSFPPALVPLAGYLTVTLGVPLAGRAWRHDPAGFVEHAACVVPVCLILAAAAWRIRRKPARRPGAMKALG